jgi:HEPN domain-containing protein
MKQPKAEAQRWLAQARSDLAYAELGAREGYHAQACFMCQQAAEKALKGLRDRFPLLSGLREAAQQLDQYYVPTRYPNGLPGGVPAERAVGLARRFLEAAEGLTG